MRTWFTRHRLAALAVTATAALTVMSSGSAQAASSARISSGGAHAEAWGDNNWGQLGNPPAGVDVPTPQSVDGADTVVAVAAGPRHGLGLLSNGNVKAWGENADGELGDGTTIDRLTARSVPGIGDVQAVAAGFNFSLALLGDGTVRAWGRNVNGQLGDGTTTNRSVPVPIIGLPGRVTAIAAGFDFALALLANGTVMAWGGNDQGQLGLGTTDAAAHTVPAAVTLPFFVTSIAAGQRHGLAVLLDGSVRSWGENTQGEVGNGNTVSPQPTPVKVVGLSGSWVKAVSGGGGHSLALLINGRVKGWGANAAGQLGDGTYTSPRLAPVDTLGLTGVTAISAGDSGSPDLAHSLAIAGNTVVAWGLNSSGQLGTAGPTTNRAERVRTGIDGPRSVSASNRWSLAS